MTLEDEDTEICQNCVIKHLRVAFQAGEEYRLGLVEIYHNGLADGSPTFQKWLSNYELRCIC